MATSLRVVGSKMARTLSKPRRRRQRGHGKTKDLIGRTIAQHNVVHFLAVPGKTTTWNHHNLRRLQTETATANYFHFHLELFALLVLLVIFHILVVGFVKPFFLFIFMLFYVICLFFVYFYVFSLCTYFFRIFTSIIWLFSYVIMKISVYLYLYTDKLYLRIWINIHRICALEVNKLLLNYH